MLKRDVFVQGLLLKWQKKVLPTASTFNEALHQARAAEQQERQLSQMHCPPKHHFRSREDKSDKAPDLKPPIESKEEKTKPPIQRSLSTRGKCFECQSTAHKWRDCPLWKVTETPGQVRGANNAAITTSQSSTESLDEKCQRLQQEWVNAEFARMSCSYKAHITVDQIAGAVGPLCYADVEIEGQEVEAMVDTGSSATIISFALFKRLGKSAGVPAAALSRPDVVLHDYNGKPIPVGAKVELTFRYHGRVVTAPVYIKSDGHEEVESCLLGTNVIFALQLMQPAAGVCQRQDNVGVTASVCLTQATRVPARKGAYLDVYTERPLHTGATVLFEPNRDLFEYHRLEIEGSLVKVGCDGKVTVPVVNKTHETVQLPDGVTVGEIEPFSEAGIVDNSEAGECMLETSVAVVHTVRTETERQQELRSTLSISPSLSKESSAELLECVMQCSDVFALEDSGRGEVIGIEHEIDTGDSPPIRQAPRRVPFAVRELMSKMVQEMLSDGVIQESSSPWASPVVLVRKKDGTLRFCIDYRRLNAVTRKDTFPLPQIDDLLDQMHGKKVFSTLDAKRGYWQINVQEQSREKTAFATYEGLYEFRVMPFGLCNAPATFQRLMQKILRGLSSFCCVYIDDILVFSDSVEEHAQHLSQVFERIQSCGLKLHPNKCSLGQSEVVFLGHVVSAAGISPDPAKLQSVRCFPTPTDVRSVREFLGLASYYRRFVPQFARIAGPLHLLTHANVDFVWTESCQRAFDQLRNLLTAPPVLAYPDFGQPFQLYTDARGKGLGAVLEQQVDGSGHPVAYASRTLSQHEQRYGITELETLAVVWGLCHFRAYLYGHKVVVYTDHAPVKSMLETKHPSGKLARWAESVAELDVEILYRPGRKHSNADALSRSPLEMSNDGELQELQVAAVVTRGAARATPGQLQTEPEAELSGLQRADPHYSAVLQFLESGVLPLDPVESKRILKEKEHFVVMERVLYWVDPSQSEKFRLCVPQAKREAVMTEAHAGRLSGHFSPKAVYAALAKRYWWEGMYKDVHTHCRGCLTCATYQGTGRRTRPTLMPIPVGGAFH